MKGFVGAVHAYAPPEHADGTVQVTKADAEAAEEHFDGHTTE